MKVLKMNLLLLILLSLTTAISYGQTAKNYYERGIGYGVVGEFEEAQQEFKKAVEADPFYIPARICLKLSEDAVKQRIKTETALHLFKGISYAYKRVYDEAIAEYKRAIEISPDYAGAHSILGAAYLYKQMYDEAITEYKKAIEINPQYTEAYNNLGLAYVNKEMFDEAIAEWKKAIEINPNYAWVHNNLGVAYDIKGMHDEAIAEHKEALKINPDYAEAHNNLAVSYYHKGEYSLAIKHCDIAIELGHEVHPGFFGALESHRER